MTMQPRGRNKMPLHLDSLDSSSHSSPTNRSKARSPGRRSGHQDGRGISELLKQELERFANSQESFILAALNLQQQQICRQFEKLVLQVGFHDLHDGSGQATPQPLEPCSGPPGERAASKSETAAQAKEKVGAGPEPPKVVPPALTLPGQATLEAEASKAHTSCNDTGASSSKARRDTLIIGGASGQRAMGSLREERFHLHEGSDTIEMMNEIKKFKSKGRKSTLSALEGSPSCKRIVSSSRFEAAIALCLAGDAVVLGLEANAQISEPQSPVPSWLETMNTIFFAIFLVELCLRISAQRCSFVSYQNPQLAWNLFDFCVVGSGCVERILNLFSKGAVDASALRVVRLTRITRGVRIVRVIRMFRDLRVMVQGCLSSMQPLLWGLCLLTMMMYIFAIAIIQESLDEVAAQDGNGGVLTAEELTYFKIRFGSLERAMYTLFQSITGGEDWGGPAQPLLQMRPILALVYCLYIAVATLCVLNIINGVFVDNAKKMAALDEEMVMMEQLEQRGKWFKEVKEIFSLAGDGNCMVNVDDFTEKLKDYRLQAWLRKVGVHVESHSAAGFFELIDNNGDGYLELDEFARALQQVHGQARSVDLARVHAECRTVKKDLQNLCTVVQAAFAHLAPQVDTSQLAFCGVGRKSQQRGSP
eukprot:TRINITY_DN11147_c0_g1_i1.p1 TRINITY_DN11147_c0_g1~~TRINITY_DN11147_c0_g1_i1.p1  ORF type:complete len:648 (-),score=109.30 TRINITY_DN11147_c0_g1_i1:425-2368(-)